MKTHIIPAFSFVFLLMLTSCGMKGGDTSSVDEHKDLAAALLDNKLYAAAIEEYKLVADNPSIDRTSRANMNYLIGKVYFEHLHDFDQAAAYYVRAKQLDPNGSFVTEATKNLVASLEKNGQMVDAKRQLDAATDIVPSPQKPGDQIVAKISGQPIWRSEIEEEIQSLPAEQQKQFLQPSEKAKFLHNYVGVELLYHAAQRENFGDRPEIKKQRDAFAKRLMVDRYLREKVFPSIKIDTADVHNFYVVNKHDRYKDAPFDSVKTEVFLDYQSDKMESAYSDYLRKLTEAEKVEFLEHNL